MPFAPGVGSLPPFKFFVPPNSPPLFGKLSGSRLTAAGITSINLTTLAGTDWAAFGYNTNGASIERKKSGGSLIGTLSQVGSQALTNFNQSANAQRYQITWTDGTPDASISNESYVVLGGSSEVNAGVKFTVPAGIATQTLIIYAALSLNSVSVAVGKLTAILSDSSALPYVDVSFTKNSSADKVCAYTITYAAASNGQTLAINLVNNTTFAQRVQIYAATLAGPLALLANSSIVTSATVSSSGVASLLTGGRASAAALAGFSGVAALLGIGKAVAKAAAQFSGAVRLMASGAVASAGSLAPTGFVAALRAYTPTLTAARGSPIGKAFLAVYGASKAIARAGIGTSGIVALMATARASAAGFAFLAGVVQLSGRSRTRAAATSAASVKAWLTAFSTGQGQANAPVKGTLTLLTNSSTRGYGKAMPSFRVALTALSSFSSAIARAWASLFAVNLFRPTVIDPDYIVQYPAPVWGVSYPLSTRFVDYPYPVRVVSYPIH